MTHDFFVATGPSQGSAATVLPAESADRAQGRRRRTTRLTGRSLRPIVVAVAAVTGLATLTPLGLTSASSAGTMPVPTFAATSWWNTPLGGAPVDANSARYIADSQVSAHTQNYLKLSMGAWGAPVYDAVSTDPMYTITPTSYGKTVSVRIPVSARPQPTSDAALTVYDPSTGQVVGLWKAAFDPIKGTWTSAGIDRYYLSSDGVAAKAGGIAGNEGHRGISGHFRGLRQDEVLSGAINHRFEVFWWATAPQTPEGPRAYWPMVNAEQNKGGIVPEGTVVRIKSSVDLGTRNLSPAALVIAQALQKYGAVVGDNSGSGNQLKVQSNANWTGLLATDALKSIPWSDYEFVQGGYRP